MEFQSEWVSKEKQSVIEAACAKVGMERLKAVERYFAAGDQL